MLGRLNKLITLNFILFYILQVKEATGFFCALSQQTVTNKGSRFCCEYFKFSYQFKIELINHKVKLTSNHFSLCPQSNSSSL